MPHYEHGSSSAIWNTSNTKTNTDTKTKHLRTWTLSFNIHRMTTRQATTMRKENGTSYKILHTQNICLKTCWQTTNTHIWRKYKSETLKRPDVSRRGLHSRKFCYRKIKAPSHAWIWKTARSEVATEQTRELVYFETSLSTRLNVNRKGAWGCTRTQSARINKHCRVLLPSNTSKAQYK